MRAKFVRLLPKTWAQHGIGLRVELEGCRYSECSEAELISGRHHYLSDSHITASSQKDGNHGPSRSRLNTPSDGDQSGGWVPEYNDDEQWIQVDLGYTIIVTGIAIQGQYGGISFVTEFTVSYSTDMKTWHDVSEPEDEETTLFEGNLDNEHVRKRYFAQSFKAQGIRINPTAWNHSIAIRWEVLGCPGPGSARDLGCFADIVEDRDLPFSDIIDTPGGMTREICATHCFNEGFPFAGVQYSFECRCGRSYGKYGPTTGCNMRCSGDPSQTCGGSSANNIMTTGLSPAYEGCSDHWTEMGGYCYRFFTEPATWDSAEYKCKEIGPNVHLASINSIEEQQFLETQLALYEADVWIGLHCKRQNNMFEWVNGEAVQFTNWARREPNSYHQDEDCVMIYYRDESHPQFGRWNDEPCGGSREYPYMCQRPKEVMDPPVEEEPDEGCPAAWVGYRWKCFTFVTITEDWEFGNSACEGMGGRLARIEDEAEQSFLAYNFAGRGEEARFWTDISNKDDLSTFKFSNGDALPVTFWGENQPESHDEPTFVVMDASEHGLWRNIDGKERSHYICERDREGYEHPTETPTDPPSGECAEGWKSLGDSHCILINAVEDGAKKDWFDAQADCVSRGGALVSIHDQETQDDLFTYLRPEEDNFWIGLYKTSYEGGYTWSDGTPFEYNNWDEGQPGDEHERFCTELLYTSEGKWGAAYCDDRKHWVCKIEKGVTPIEPTTKPPIGECAEDWVEFGEEHCTLIVSGGENVRKDWFEAQADCVARRGALVSIHSEQAQDTLFEQLETHDGDFWIGLYKTSYNGDHVWSDDSEVVYTNWNEGEPEEDSEKYCTEIKKSAHGKWSPEYCAEKRNYVCKIHRDTTPLVPTTSPPNGECSEGWEALGQDYCVQINSVTSNMRRDWFEAQDDCVNKLGALVSIHELNEQDQLYDYIRSHESDFWIGLYKTGYEGGHTWSDGTPFEFSHWAEGQPGDEHEEYCTEMMHASSGEWGTAYCSARRNWICKVQRGVNPTIPVTDPLPTPGPGESCYPYPDSWKFYDDRCWFFSPLERETIRNKMEWASADQACSNLAPGARLASIHNSDHNDFVRGQLMAVEEYDVWLGLNELSDGGWTWSDGSPTEYRNWGENQPDETTPKLCSTMNLVYGSHGTWNNKHCSETMHFVCSFSHGAEPPITEPPKPIPGACPEGYVTYGDKCFKFVDELMSWSEARENCLNDGTHPYSLASIHNHWETYFLISQAIGREGGHWIGLHLFNEKEGQFGWADNSPVSYTNWDDDEPNGGSEEACVEIYVDEEKAGRWNDVECGAPRKSICMRYKDPNIEPEPYVKSSTNKEQCGHEDLTYWEGTGNCYKISTSPRSWSDAQSHCQEDDSGNLASVRNVFEQAYLAQMYYALDNYDGRSVWIGLHDTEDNGKYQWADGTSVPFTHWASSQPAEPDKCVQMSLSEDGYWSVQECGDSDLGAVCKVTLVDEPEPTDPPKGLCPSTGEGEEWVNFNGYCYLFNTSTSRDFTDALEQCSSRGSSLVTIQSDEETQFLIDNLGDTIHWQWIGLTRVDGAGWRWLDGSAYAYTNWNEGEPSDPDGSDGENCGEMYHSGVWNDVSCSDNNGYICKVAQSIDPGSTLLPTSIPTVATETTKSSPTFPSTTPRSTTVPSVPTEPSQPTANPTRPNEENPGGGGGGMSSSQIAGLIFGLLFGFILLGFVALIVVRKRQNLPLPGLSAFDNPSYSSNDRVDLSGPATQTQAATTLSFSDAYEA